MSDALTISVDTFWKEAEKLDKAWKAMGECEGHIPQMDFVEIAAKYLVTLSKEGAKTWWVLAMRKAPTKELKEFYLDQILLALNDIATHKSNDEYLPVLKRENMLMLMLKPECKHWLKPEDVE